ncbi:copper resistance D family protein [Anaerobacillus sp. MEB173]|uniref:copper resistance D family protein n=1 Tax=Anaerobacillus sp. MEB173 TaxID=3383345 RepID=UPI003F8E0097
MSFTVLRIIELLIVIYLSGFLFLRWFVWNEDGYVPKRVLFFRGKFNEFRITLIGFILMTLTSAIHFYLYVDEISYGFMVMEPVEAFWKIGTSTLFGVISWLRPILVGLLLILVIFLRNRRLLKSFIILLLVLSFSYSGHAYYYEMISVHFVHLLIVMFWFISLTQLAISSLLLDRNECMRWYYDQVKAFSTLAGFLIILLTISGVLLAMVYIQSIDQLFATFWGQAMILKTGLFFVALIFAAGNRFYLLKKFKLHLDEGRPFNPHSLYWSIRAEWVVVLVIIIVAGIISTSSPPTDIPHYHH